MAIRQGSNSAISRILTTFGNWIGEKSKEQHGTIEPSSFLSVSAVVLSLSAFLYLGQFYGYFGINYFRFFTFEDGLTVLYQKGRLFLLFPMILGFAVIGMSVFHIFRKNDIREGLQTNLTFFLATCIAILGTGTVFGTVGELSLKACIITGILAGGIVIMYFLLDKRTLYFYPLLLGYGLVLCAKVDAKKIMDQKITFNVKMVDQTEPIPVNESDKTYWVGTTSKMIYFYSDATRQVIQIPMEQIRAVNYNRPYPTVED